jgi:hypothetical protein
VLEPDGEPQVARRPRYGTCHRCGWKGPVAKVSRRERRNLEIGRSFGRLCDECVSDLLGAQDATATGVKAGKLKAVRNRHVA